MRLDGVIRLGYYPTPPEIVALLAQHLRAPAASGRQSIRLLDPCAGQGAALAQLGQALGGETFGIELSEERARMARSVLDHLLHGSAFGVRLTNSVFSLLFLNPPYDDDQEQRRLEHHFLTTFHRALAPGGILCYLVPQERLALSARFLSNQYEELSLYRFPDGPEGYDRFKQVILIGRRRSTTQADRLAEAFLAEIAQQGPAAIDPITAQPETVYDLPLLPRTEVLFAAQHFDASQAEAEAARRGLLAKGVLCDQLWPPEEARVRPLLPLKKTHRALLMASGFLDNVVLDNGERRVIVKGRTVKELVYVPSEDPKHRISREMVRTNITLLDLASGRVTRVDNGAGATATDNGKEAS